MEKRINNGLGNPKAFALYKRAVVCLEKMGTVWGCWWNVRNERVTTVRTCFPSDHSWKSMKKEKERKGIHCHDRSSSQVCLSFGPKRQRLKRSIRGCCASAFSALLPSGHCRSPHPVRHSEFWEGLRVLNAKAWPGRVPFHLPF